LFYNVCLVGYGVAVCDMSVVRSLVFSVSRRWKSHWRHVHSGWCG